MKLRCPQCSTVVDAVSDPIRCPNCGFTAPLPPPAAQPAAPSPPPAPTMNPYSQAPRSAPYGGSPYGGQTYDTPPPTPSIYGGARPIGKQRSVAAVIIFSIITLGIYTYVWEWKVSKEMDRFTGEPKHNILRTGILMALIGILAVIVGGAAAYTSGVFDPAFDPETAEFSGALVGGALLLLAGLVLLLVGTIMIIIGLYRVWSNLEKDDKMRGESKPTSSTLLLVLFILGLVIPYVGFAVLLAVYGVTQSALNRTWKVYGMAPPPQAYAGTAPV